MRARASRKSSSVRMNGAAAVCVTVSLGSALWLPGSRVDRLQESRTTTVNSTGTFTSFRNGVALYCFRVPVIVNSLGPCIVVVYALIHRRHHRRCAPCRSPGASEVSRARFERSHAAEADDVVSAGGGGSFMQATAGDATSISATGRLVRIESAPEE